MYKCQCMYLHITVYNIIVRALYILLFYFKSIINVIMNIYLKFVIQTTFNILLSNYI
jgi:hypothetical protein